MVFLHVVSNLSNGFHQWLAASSRPRLVVGAPTKGLDRPHAPGLAGLERTVHSSAIFHEFRGLVEVNLRLERGRCWDVVGPSLIMLV